MTASSSQSQVLVFRRLERTSLMIAAYPDFPGKDGVLERCRDDVEQRFQQGTLTWDQRVRLLAILEDEKNED